MNADFQSRFLTKTEDTGRFMIYSNPAGRTHVG